MLLPPWAWQHDGYVVTTFLMDYKEPGPLPNPFLCTDKEQEVIGSHNVL